MPNDASLIVRLETFRRHALGRWPWLRPCYRFGYGTLRWTYRLSGARLLWHWQVRRRRTAAAKPASRVDQEQPLAAESAMRIAREAENLFHGILLLQAHGAAAGGNVKVLCDYLSAVMLQVFAAMDAMFVEHARRFALPMDLPGRKMLRAGAPEFETSPATLRMLDDVLAAKPDFGEARLARGRLLRSAGHLEPAIADLRVATARPALLPVARYDFSHVVVGHYECALALEQLGRDEEALAELSKAYTLAPHFSAAWRKAADILHRCGAHADAARCQEQALQFFPWIPTLPLLPRPAT
jgi:tetratricopeptide (TPR) repeat protein